MEIDDLDPTWESLPMDHFTLSISSTNLKAPITTSTNLKASNNNPQYTPELPDDIIERILSFLPISSVIRASATCARWREIIRSRRRSLFWAHSTKPWYFMFTQNESAGGFAYDPVTRKWFNFSLPCVEKSTWLVSSSFGLICCLDTDSFTRIFVSNPITRQFTLLSPPSPSLPDYTTLSISVNKDSLSYTITLLQSKQLSSQNFHQWDFSICSYSSKTCKWVQNVKRVLNGWRGGDDSAICDGILYCLIQSSGVTANSVPRHRLLIYDFNEDCNFNNILDSSIPVPCSLTCGRLMNLKERLVLVGGIAKNERTDIIKGIGIWELLMEASSGERNWREVAKMPHKYFQGFGEFDDVFASSGANERVYVQSYGSTAVLVYEMERMEWRWAGKCPVSKRFPLQLFTGFCFEPRLETSSEA